MQYSIRGSINTINSYDIIETINNYAQELKSEQLDDSFEFEALINNKNDNDSLFNELKKYIDESGSYIDWHECTHDEPITKPCVIIEIYKGVR